MGVSGNEVQGYTFEGGVLETVQFGEVARVSGHGRSGLCKHIVCGDLQ
jgi:hypothetical protein